MTRTKRLGRGLDALLGLGAEGADGARGGAAERLVNLPLDVIERGRYQPRMDLRPETLNELADSIRAQGVVQPIVVRAIGADRYEIIAGERRWRASQMAGLAEIPAIVREVPDEAAMSMALIENIQREDLNPLEEARALRRLVEEFELTHQQVAAAIGRSRAAVSNLLRLLELDPEVKRLLEEGEIEMGHARALLALDGATQARVARDVVARGLSVRETEQLVRRVAAGDTARRRRSAPAASADIRRLERDLGERLGASVRVRHGADGKGSLSIRYNSLDELEGILAHIR